MNKIRYANNKILKIKNVMASLRKTVVVFVAWAIIFAFFAIHMILSRDDNGQIHMHGHTRKSNIPAGDTSTTGEVEVVNLNFQSEATKCIQDVLGSKESVATTVTTPGGLPEPSIDRVLLLKEENLNLKEQISNLKKEIDNLLKNKNQLKTLTKTLIAQQSTGKEAIPKLDSLVPWVFAITPTHKRYTQKADLVRLSQTLQHVTNLHWLIVEDSHNSTTLVRNVLLDSGLSFTHLHVKTPDTMQRKRGEPYNKHHRGVPQRNLALKWIRSNMNRKKAPGVVYFMDDDNTYHKDIFDEMNSCAVEKVINILNNLTNDALSKMWLEETVPNNIVTRKSILKVNRTAKGENNRGRMRWTKKVSAWPVALTGGARFQGPIASNGKVTGFHTNWAPDRKFPLDMASFAVNLKVLLEDFPKVVFDKTAKRGYLEPTFLAAITTMDQLEPLADNCTKVLVWHTRTETPKIVIQGEKQLIKAGHPSDPNIET